MSSVKIWRLPEITVLLSPKKCTSRSDIIVVITVTSMDIQSEPTFALRRKLVRNIESMINDTFSQAQVESFFYIDRTEDGVH